MARHVELCEDCKEGSRMKTSDNHGRVPPMFAASQRRYCAGGLSAGLATSAPRLPVRLLFSALFAAALAQPTNKPSDHERGQQERDDHAYADENISENDSGAVLDGHGARSRSASVPLYGQSSGLTRRFMH